MNSPARRSAKQKRDERFPSYPLAASVFRPLTVTTLPLALQLHVEDSGQPHVDPADPVLRHAPRVDQRADRVAIADVDARVVVRAPDEEVTGPRGRERVRHRPAVVEPVVVARDGSPGATDAIQ